jgi:2-phospho-L-lactate transferase/gluconeogenesis factor (CofD/UPF0052 family)
MNVTVLAGGVGASRFLEGVVQVVAPRDLTPDPLPEGKGG